MSELLFSARRAIPSLDSDPRGGLGNVRATLDGESFDEHGPVTLDEAIEWACAIVEVVRRNGRGHALRTVFGRDLLGWS